MKRLLALFVIAGFAATAFAAEPYPSRPIKINVPYSPGGPADLLARVVGQKLTERWGQPVIVDNRPGASGMIGASVVAKSPADGYTLLLAPVGIMVVNPWIYPNITYDPIKDFKPISQLTTSPFLLAVSSSVKAANVDDFVKYAKASPDKVTIGNAGNGTGQHLAGVYFSLRTGVDITQVSYKGSGDATNDLLANVISAQFDMISLVPQVKAGKVRALGVTSRKRLSFLPDVPTIAEQTGMKDFEFEAWNGIAAPAGTPDEIIDKLQKAISQIMMEPDVKEKLAGLGLQPVGNTPKEFAAIIASDMARYEKLVKAGNVK